MIVPGRHRCVLFDVDGTIAETESHGHLPAFNRALAEAGLPWHWSRDDYRRLLKTTGGYERLLHHAEEAGDDPDAMAELLRHVHQAKNRHYVELLAAGAVPPRAGLRELILALAANDIAWGVVSTTCRANWRALWTHTLMPLQLPPPAVVVCGEDVSAKKPDPEAYLIALQRLDQPSSRCCVIEDSRNGMLAARLAGLEVAIVRSEFFADERFDQARVVVDELTALVPAVERV
jgi:HAD superfamily hydrolase (TIGR01509 family)